MPELSEITRLTALDTPAGDDVLPIVDVSAAPDHSYGPAIRKIRVNQIRGLSAADVTVDTDGGTVTASRLTFISGGSTSTINIPAPSGTVREIIVMNGGSGAATVTSAAANIRGFLTGTQTAATTNSVAAFTAATFMSDGTTWFRVR